MDTKTTIACSGGEGSLGHPRVFLRLKDDGITCPYCGKKYDGEGCEIADQSITRKKSTRTKTVDKTTTLKKNKAAKNT